MLADLEVRMSRPDWVLGISSAVGAIADCRRRKVGAVIYDPVTFHILSTGYNGRPSGLPGCLTEGGCPRGLSDQPSYAAGNHAYLHTAVPCDALHAEDNALRRARERGIDVAGMHVAVTDEPCNGCYVLLRHYSLAHALWPSGERVL